MYRCSPCHHIPAHARGDALARGRKDARVRSRKQSECLVTGALLGLGRRPGPAELLFQARRKVGRLRVVPVRGPQRQLLPRLDPLLGLHLCSKARSWRGRSARCPLAARLAARQTATGSPSPKGKSSKRSSSMTAAAADASGLSSAFTSSAFPSSAFFSAVSAFFSAASAMRSAAGRHARHRYSQAGSGGRARRFQPRFCFAQGALLVKSS